MKILLSILTVAALFLAVSQVKAATTGETTGTTTAATTTEKEIKPQTTCPVTGDPIDKKHYVDYEGKRIYFCCGACPPEFKKDPKKYMDKMAAEGITLENAPVNPQTMCPVTGDPIDKQYYVDYKGSRIYFCCGACPPEFKKHPKKYMDKLKAEGVTLEKAPGKPQTMCPVMDVKINKKIFADYEGKRIYFCCTSCVEDFKKDPKKYMDKMAAEGIELENAPVEQPAKGE